MRFERLIRKDDAKPKKTISIIKKINFVCVENQNLLIEAEELHQSALKITIDAFGEVNVQTAKHYGNLGRLYQSMAKYQVRKKNSINFTILTLKFIWCVFQKFCNLDVFRLPI